MLLGGSEAIDHVVEVAYVGLVEFLLHVFYKILLRGEKDTFLVKELAGDIGLARLLELFLFFSNLLFFGTSTLDLGEGQGPALVVTGFVAPGIIILVQDIELLAAVAWLLFSTGDE